MTPSNRRIIIIGAGAVGGTIGGVLAESGVNVELVARGAHGSSIRENGLTLKFHDRQFNTSLICHQAIADVRWRHDDLVLIATKLTDANQVLEELLQSAGPTVPVVCVSNGLQGERWAAKRFETVLSMIIWLPSTHLRPGEVSVFLDSECPGILDLGPTQGSLAMDVCHRFSDRLKFAKFDSVVRPNIQRWKYAKLVTNLANAAQAMVIDDWQSVADKARAEGERVLVESNVDRISTQELIDRTSHLKLMTIDGQARSGGSTWQSRQRGKTLESAWI